MNRVWIGHGICNKCGYRGPMLWWWLGDDKFAECVECDNIMVFDEMENE